MPERAIVDLSDERFTLVGLVLETAAGLRSELGRVHADHGIAGSDFDALLRLGRSPWRSLRMIDLAAQTGMSTSGVTRLVDRLEADGLVRRAISPHDRRSWLVTLTDEGDERLADDAADVLAAIDRLVVAGLPPAELDTLGRLLRVLRDRVAPAASADGRVESSR